MACGESVRRKNAESSGGLRQLDLQMSVNKRECRVCLCPHQDDIHAATLRVRAWQREQVTPELRPAIGAARKPVDVEGDADDDTQDVA